MIKPKINLKKIFIFFTLFFLLNNISANAEVEDVKINAVIDQLQIIAQDLKTLEKQFTKLLK